MPAVPLPADEPRGAPATLAALGMMWCILRLLFGKVVGRPGRKG
ncbi:hypothetical protein [Streptomyces sp. NPDC058398]